MKESQKWEFKITGAGCLMSRTSGDREVLGISFGGDELTASFSYSVKDRPLILRAPAKESDSVSIVIRPFRIELSINGTLLDEEWPFGEPLFLEAETVICNIILTESDVPAEEEKPSFSGSFESAEGWRPGNGVFTGDCMPYSDGERYHVLYLKDRHHHGSKWGLGAHQWEHISTKDLVRWDIHPMAVPIDHPLEASICTGSWIYDNGKYWLYYSVRTTDGSPAPIRRSVSDDGYHFKKDPDFSFTLSERYCGARARDPKAVRGEDGLLHLFVTTTDMKSSKGCLAHLTSSDSKHFTEIGNIYEGPDENEPECPDYFTIGGKYYLIFSHRGKGSYLVSDSPFSGWKKLEDNTIPCRSVPKCAVWQDRIIFTGFTAIGGYAGTLTFMEAKQLPDGRLTFAPVPETEKHKRENEN